MSLDPLTNRREREEAAFKAKKTPELNPPFPHRATEIDLASLGIDVDPPKIDTKSSE